VPRDLRLQRGGIHGEGVEEDISACDKRLDIGEPQLLEQRAESVHLHGVAAHVDRPEEGDVPLDRVFGRAGVGGHASQAAAKEIAGIESWIRVPRQGGGRRLFPGTGSGTG
jgi:hypothetical protein